MLRTALLCISVISVSSALSDSDVYISKTSDDYVPCERGWHYFRDKCYRVAARKLTERFTWNNALSRCKSYGADLVSIQSREEQDFIVAYLQLDVKALAWIGLNDRDKEGDYRWSDGSVFNYTNWKPNEPSVRGQNGEDEDCVHVFYEAMEDNIGTWSDRHCESPIHAFCEMKSNPRKKSPNLKYCSSEEGGGWKYENSCFHIITENETWRNAEKHCKSRYHGHLLTIRDKLQDYFLELALPSIESDVWIGIKIQGELQQKWTSGWYVSYDRFHKEEKYAEGTCVARKNRKEWKTVPCTRELPFICEVSKESPIVLKPPPVGAHCPTDLDDWRDLGGEYCYYIETTKSVNFYIANFDCQRRGGHLLSLHSREEAEILKPFFKYKKNQMYIGLIRHLAYNEETFAWIDGSPLDFEDWDHNEPNKEDEKCVYYETRTLKWNDIPCDRDYFGYICSVKKIIPNSRINDGSAECANFCIAPTTYLFGLISQCNEAKRIS